MYTSDELINALKNRETLRKAFVVHRADNRPKEGPNSPKKIGFSVGEQNLSQTNSYLACQALSNFTENGLQNFCTIWKNGSGSLTIGQADSSGYFRANSTMVLDEETKKHELIRYKNFMQGVSTDAEDCHKGDNEYTITIPEPNENGYQCILATGKPVCMFLLYSGISNDGHRVFFTVYISGQHAEIDFFTEIPADWVV